MTENPCLIVADANIPRATEAFETLGEVRLLPGREISRSDLMDIRALIVRSVTRVNEALLKGTPVGFVGTATIGTDHLDIQWLDETGITWKSAAGCNARSVVEYVLTAILEWCHTQELLPEDMNLGIVGHGNIGSRLAVVAKKLGMTVRVCDPPKARLGELSKSISLDELLKESDIVTLHVPYSKGGSDPTHHLIGSRELDMLPEGAVLINTSRGAVVDNEAALKAGSSGINDLILDVFEGEPEPNRDLVKACYLATPHIAGYSLEGKINGTNMMAAALAAHLGLKGPPPLVLPLPPDRKIDASRAIDLDAMRLAASRSYDIWADHKALLEGVHLPDGEWGVHFDRLRREYRERREFSGYTVSGLDEESTDLVKVLGFQVES